MRYRIIKTSYLIVFIVISYLFSSPPARLEAQEWALPEFGSEETKDNTLSDHINQLRDSIALTMIQSLESLPEYPLRSGNQVDCYLLNNTSTDLMVTSVIARLDDKIFHYDLPVDNQNILYQTTTKRFSIKDIRPGKHKLRIKFLLQELPLEKQKEGQRHITIKSCCFLNDGYCLHHAPAYDTRLIRECSLDFSLRKNQTLPVMVSFDYSSVSSDYRSVAQIAPIPSGSLEEADATLGIAEGFFLNQAYLKCIWVLNNILKKFPDYPRLDKVLFLMGESFFRVQMYSETIKISQQLRQKFPQSRYNYLLMLRAQMIHYMLQRYANAIADFQRFDHCTDVEVLDSARYIAAKSHYYEKHFSQAKHILKSIYSQLSYYLPAQYLLARCCLKAGQYDEAVIALKNIVESKPCMTCFPIIPEMESIFGREMEKEGLIERSNLLLGKIFYQRKEYEESLNAFEAIPERSAQYLSALTGKGLVFLRLRREEEVIEIVDKFSQKSMENRFLSDARFSLANTLQKEGNYADACASYEDSVRRCQAGLSVIQALEQDPHQFNKLFLFILGENSSTDVLPPTSFIYQEVRNYPKLQTNLSLWYALLRMEKTLQSMKSVLIEPDLNCEKKLNLLFQLIDRSKEKTSPVTSDPTTSAIKKAYKRLARKEKRIKGMKETVISQIKKDVHEGLTVIADRLYEIHDLGNLFIMVAGLKEQIPRAIQNRFKDFIVPLKKAIKTHTSFLAKHPYSHYAEQVIFQLAEYHYLRSSVEIQHHPELLIQTKPNFDEAIKLYEKLLVEFPQGNHTDKALYALAIAYQNQGSIVLAQDLFQRLVDNFPDSFLVPEVLLGLAELSFDQNNFTRASDYYERSIALGKFPEQYQDSFRYKLGWSYYQQSRYKEAFEIFVSLADRFVRTNRLPLLQEMVHQLAKIFSGYDSLDHVKRLISFMEGTTGHCQLIKEFADILFAQERFEEAIIAYQWAIEQYPLRSGTPILQSRIEQCHLNLHNQASAHAVREALITRHGKGTPWWEENKTEEARKQVSSLIDEAIRNSTLYLLDLKHESNYREQITFYKENLTRFPSAKQLYIIHFSLAECFYKIGQYKEALAEYEQTVQNTVFDKFAEDAAYKQILCLEKIIEQNSLDKPPLPNQWMPEEQKLIAATNHFLSSFPNHESLSEVLYKKGELYCQKNLYEEGAKAFERIVREFPASKIRLPAMKMLAKSYFSQQRFGLAGNTYANILTEFDQKLTTAQSPELLTARSNAFKMTALCRYKEAELHLTQGAPLEAAAKFKVTADTFPEIEIADIALLEAATIYQAHGAQAKALEIFLRILKEHPQSESAPKALLNIALHQERNKQLWKAARTYEKIYFEYPQFSGSPGALYKAGVLYGKLENWSKVINIFSLYQTELNLEPPLAIEAIFRRGYAIMRTGDIAKANSAFHAVLNTYKRYKKHDNTLSAYYPAWAQFLISDTFFKKYNKLQIEEISDRGMQPKLTLLKKVIWNYTKTAEFKIGEWTTQAMFRMGLAIDNFCEELSDRSPALLNTGDSSYLLNIQLQQRIVEFLKKAVSFYKKNIQLAEKNSIDDIWIARSKENLTKDYWKIGLLYEKIYFLVKEAPVPATLNETEARHYRKALLSKALPYRDKAIETYCNNTNGFTANIAYSVWIEQSYTRLAALRPELYLRDETILLDEDRAGLSFPNQLLWRK
ncbi:MAG: tetratricopeptide repeat protein [Deltaproteobacteria bacterium]|nr:tetratricopeptide repeat protein [Deltaproteobacteria bacterium]